MSLFRLVVGFKQKMEIKAQMEYDLSINSNWVDLGFLQKWKWRQNRIMCKRERLVYHCQAGNLIRQKAEMQTEYDSYPHVPNIFTHSAMQKATRLSLLS